MAQKKKASAARTATASVTLPSPEEETAPVWLVSAASYDGDSRQALVVPDSRAGSVVEVSLSENGGGAPRRRDATAPGKGDGAEKAHRKEFGTSNGSETGFPVIGPGGSAVTSTGKDESMKSTLLRGECEKALVALRRGNSTKALRLIKDVCNRNETSGIAHRVQGHIFMRLASVIEDANAKQRHFSSALESARKASSLSPKSVEYAHFYAQLLFEAAKDSKGYDEVVRECERAVNIDDPVDPARESLHNEQQQELATPEARIEHVRQELKALVQKANISSLSNWMKTLGNGAGEEKLRFVQMRKFADQDPMEQRVSQPKRPHEVKKVVKTPEERRKEIEVRVAAARLLQQRDSSANGGTDSLEDHEKTLQKKTERRKSSGSNSRKLSKPLSTEERADRVRQFWHALTQEKREILLLVSIAELKDHLTSWKEVGGLVKSHAASDALSESLEFAQEKKTWRFWACCQCGERFASELDFNHHTWEHIGTYPHYIQNHPLELAQACGLGCQSEGTSGETGEEDIIQDRLFLNEDFTQLLLDERVIKEFPEELPLPIEILELGGSEEIVVEEGSAAHRPPLPLMKGKGGEIATTHMDLQLSWIFGTAEYELQPSGWKHFREEQGQRGRDVYRALEKEVQGLLSLRTKKYELVSCEEALNLVEQLCIVEKNRRDQQFDTGKSFETVLKDRRRDLSGALSSSEESEMDAITNVLDAISTSRSSLAHRLPFDGSLGVRVNDSDEDEEDPWGIRESTHRGDSRVEAVIRQQKEQLSNEVTPLDVKIIKVIDDLQNLEIKFRQLAVLDYRAVTLPLVKSFLQSRLEGEAEKDAMQKSDAAQEAFLAELANDQKRLGSKEVENLKQARGKTKDKRKAKDQKKAKDVKRATSNSVQQGESASVELDDIGEADNWDWVVGGDTKQQREAQILQQTELLEEERKLLEALELQRHVEEETKQKHLHQTELLEEERKLLEALELQRRVEEETKQKHLRKSELLEEERKLGEALELQRQVEEENKRKHLDEEERKKKIAKQILQPLEDGKDATGTTLTTVDVVSPCTLPTSALQLLPVQNGSKGLTEVTDASNGQTILPPNHGALGSHSLLSRNEHSGTDQLCIITPLAQFTRGIYEQQLAKDSCSRGSEKAGPVEAMPPAGKDVLLVEDGDHLNFVQKKPRGGGSRNRRRRGPRIYAEEHMIADQDSESPKVSDFATGSGGSRTLVQQNVPGNNGRIATADHPKPLLRQNTSRSFDAAPANGVHVVQPLLLLPAPPSFEGSGGHEGKKTLRQLQAEQDDEERFQADLEQAMRQSLDMLTSQTPAPIVSSSSASSPPTTVSSNVISGDHQAQQLLDPGTGRSLTRTVETPLKEVGEVGKGLRNEIGQYNCFLNVVIQSLWHLRRFREELLADSSMQHVHVGNPCVVCALRDIFLGLNTPIHYASSKDAVAPTSLRIALSALYSDSAFFQVAQMNDASEVLAVIFDCLHKAFVPNSSSDGASKSSTTGGSWDCQGQHRCMAHILFGLNVAEQMNCQSCGLESGHLKYTAFFHYINASALRNVKVSHPESSMDELLNLVDMNHQTSCDTETGGCGRQNHTHRFLHKKPHVFTTVFGWQNGRESPEDISATVDTMDAVLDVGVIYRGLEKGFKHRLVSVVCYYGQHYHCFAYNQEHCRWVMFDDSTVKVIGDWSDVTSTCRRGHLQPQVLFYEEVAVSSQAVC